MDVCHVTANRDTCAVLRRRQILLEIDILRLIKIYTTGGVSIWIGLSWTKFELMEKVYVLQNEAISCIFAIGLRQLY
jgi:hypothetical protein